MCYHLFCGQDDGPHSQVLSKLMRHHGVKVASAVSVEDCCLAAGEVVGHKSIMSASKMNSVIVLFLSSVDKANELVEKGIDLSLHLKVDDFDYVIYATTEQMKRFSCGEVGHLVCACSGKNNENDLLSEVTVNSKLSETVPSNVAPSAAGSYAVGERTVENLPAGGRAAIQVSVLTEDRLIAAEAMNVQACQSAINNEMQKK